MEARRTGSAKRNTIIAGASMSHNSAVTTTNAWARPVAALWLCVISA